MSRIHPTQLQEDDINTQDGLMGEVYQAIYKISLDQQVEASEMFFLHKADPYFRTPLTGHKVVENVLDECLEVFYQEVLKWIEANATEGVRLARRIRFAMNDLSHLGYSYGPFTKKYAGYVFLAAVWAVYDGVIPEKNDQSRFLNETHHASISLGMQNAARKYFAQRQEPPALQPKP